MKDFKRELASLLNCHGFDALTNTPDHDLADFIAGILLIMPRGKRTPPVMPDPLPPLFGPPCDWDGCASRGPNRLQGKNFCNQHFHEATQP